MSLSASLLKTLIMTNESSSPDYHTLQRLLCYTASTVQGSYFVHKCNAKSGLLSVTVMYAKVDRLLKRVT